MSTTAAEAVAPAVADSACIEAIENEPLPARFGGISWSPPSRTVAPSRQDSSLRAVCTSQDWPARTVRRGVAAAPCGSTPNTALSHKVMNRLAPSALLTSQEQLPDGTPTCRSYFNRL